MKVYRVENDAGDGPFHTDEVHDAYYILHDGMTNRHPAPRNDGLSDFDYNMVFGVTSKKMLRHWFGHCPNNLAEAGFHIRQFDVPATHVRKGSVQVAFVRDKAAIIGGLDWNAI